MEYFSDVFEIRANAPILIVTEANADYVFYQDLFDKFSREEIMFASPDLKERTQGRTGGYRSAQIARNRGNFDDARRWCLLDGEESLRYGQARELFESKDLVFTLDDPDAAGCLFLNCYEMENLYLRYGAAPRMIAGRINTDRSSADKHKRSLRRSECIEAALRTSVLKIAAKIVLFNKFCIGSNYCPTNHDDNILGLIEKVSVHEDGTEAMVQRVLGYWPSGPMRDLFYAEIDQITKTLGFRLFDKIEADWTNELWMSLCDGKTALKLGLTQDYRSGIRDIQYQMVNSDFASLFRAAILKALTGQSICRPRDTKVLDNDVSEVLQLRILRDLKF